jgi:hypothetical protein
MAKLEIVNQTPAGWFPLDVMLETDGSKGRWVALMIDFDPGDPKEYRPWPHRAQQLWLRIPGKHKNKNAAWDALQDIMETRH